MSFTSQIHKLRKTFAALPDRRTGDNLTYSMADIGLSAFAVFFSQSASFLAAQKAMQQAKGRSNAQSLFEIQHIPCDNQIRQTLDPVAPEQLFPLYDGVFEEMRQKGLLENFRAQAHTLLIALDGTWYFSSQKIHCPNCSCMEHKNGEKTYYHSAITPVIVAPGQPHALSLRPEFIIPQDGHTKQDCEIAAAKRWLEKNHTRYAPLQATLLGDDLYAHQPTCRRVRLYDFHFIFVCKPDSHKTLYDWVNLLEPGRELHTLKLRVLNPRNQHWENHTYRYANQVPLAEGQDALKVNWCELTVTDAQDQVLYHNGFITDFKITDDNVGAIIASGRARWKIENENNNTLKTKGYH
ncbi:MAG: ISNCY family transposase, partial [Actinomycetota bacterium]